MVSHSPDKFGLHSHRGNGDIIVLLCQVISQDQVIIVYVTLTTGAHQGKLPFCHVWWPQAL